jgi:hypothetical protein
MEHLKLSSQLNTRANQLLLSGDAVSALGHYGTAFEHLRVARQVAGESDNITLDESSGSYTMAGQVAVRRRYISEQDAASSDDSCFWSPLYEFSHDEDGDGDVHGHLLAFYAAIVFNNILVCLHQNHHRRGWASLQLVSDMYEDCEMLLLGLTCQLQLDCNEVLASILQNQANVDYNRNDFDNVRYLMDKVFLLQLQDRIKKEASANTIAPEA